MREYYEAGVRHIVALRGDSPNGSDAPYVAHPDGYQRTEDLVAAIKKIGDIEVSVSAYPEKHPESSNLLADIEALKRKVDAGADRAITQFFFDNSVYFRFVDIAAAAGIHIPIAPGIVPVQNFKQTASFARRAGASVPRRLAERFEGLDDDPATRRLVAAAVCAEQVIDLIDRGVPHLHFYTMNRADLVFAICHLIGLRRRRRSERGSEPPALRLRDQEVTERLDARDVLHLLGIDEETIHLRHVSLRQQADQAGIGATQ